MNGIAPDYRRQDVLAFHGRDIKTMAESVGPARIRKSMTVEGNHFRALQCVRQLACLAHLQRVFAVEQVQTGLLRLRARFGKVYGLYRTQAHFALFPCQGEAKSPAPGAGLGYLQPYSRTIAVVTWLGHLIDCQ